MSRRANMAVVDTVIRQQILPACIVDCPGAETDFSNWSISSFTSALGTFEAIVTAVRNCDGIAIFKKVKVDQDVLLASQGLDQMFDVLIAAIDDAIDWIVTWKQPHDITTCTDPECFC